MKSKTSLFNSTLYWKNLKRFWPLWTGYLLILLVRCPWSMYHMMTNPDQQYRRDEIIYVMLHNSQTMDFSMVMVMAIACAAAVWSYLYFPRSSTWVHALPIKRSTLFVTNLLSGLTMLTAPVCVSYGLGAVMARVYRLPNMGVLGWWMLAVAGAGILFFGMSSLLAMITGNLIVLPALYFIFQCVGEFLYAIFQSFRMLLVYGSSSSSDPPSWLSPIAWVCREIGLSSNRDGVPYDMFDSWNKTLTCSFYGGKIIILSVIAGTVMLAGAYLLYRKHHTERCGDIIVVRWIRPIMKYGFIVCFALIVTLCLYTMGVLGNVERQTGSVLPVLIILLWISGLIGYFAAEMLLQKNFRVFHGRDLLHGLVWNVVMSIPLLILGLDVFGYSRWVPERDQVQKVIVTDAQGSISDEEALEQIIALQQEVVDNRKLYYKRSIQMGNSVRYGIDLDDTDAMWVRNLNLEYHMKNGRVVNRNYVIYATGEEREQAGVWKDYIRVMNMPQVVYSQYFSDDFDSTRMSDIEVSRYFREGETEEDETVSAAPFCTISGLGRKNQFYEAVVEDINAGRLQLRAYDEDKSETEYFSCALEYEVPLKNTGNQKAVVTTDGRMAFMDTHTIGVCVDVDKKSTKTYALLTEMGKQRD